MNVKLFGQRVLVEHYKSKSASKIVIPDAAQQRDTHRLGIVRHVGDMRKPAYDPATLQRSDAPVVPLVKEGDVVMFQVNQIMTATQSFVCEGRTYLHLLQSEFIARINGEEPSVDTIEMLGDYVLLKHFMRQPEGSTLFIPNDVVKESAPDFVYFKCIQKGATAGDDFKIGDELIVNFGRLTPMFIVKRNPDGTSQNEEYAYTHKDWVAGVVTEAEGAVVA